MNNDKDKQQNSAAQRRYTWPWFVLAAVLLGIVLAIVWMSYEVERTKRIRELNAPSQGK